MTGIFQGLANDNGKVPVLVVSSLPGNAVSRNGVLVSPAGEVYAISDTNQPRVFKSGIAFEESTGLLILGSEGNIPLSVPMGGMLADSNGAFTNTADDPDVIHQAVGLRNLLNAGSVTAEGLAPQIVGQLDASQDQVNKTGNNVNSVSAVDGRTYLPGDPAQVLHGQDLSPTGLDAYSFNGVAGSYLAVQTKFTLSQPFTAFVVMKRNALESATVFDNVE